MAKKKKGKQLSSRMTTLAEELGTFLGTSERKANEWLARQQQLRTQLSAIRDKATALLSQLGPGKDVKEAGGGGKKGKAGKKARAGKGGKGAKAARGGKKAAATAAARKAPRKAARPAAKRPAPMAASSAFEPEPEPMDLEGIDE